MLLSSLLLTAMAQTATSAPSGVLNLRGAGIGDACTMAIASENIYGTQPAAPTDQMLTTGSLLFTDSSVAGQQTQVLYRCRGDFGNVSVSQYSITISTADESRARELYKSAKSTVTTHLGKPGLDSDRLKSADKKEFNVVPGGPRAISTWDAARGYVVHVSMQLNATTSQWTVVTSVAPQAPPAAN